MGSGGADDAQTQDGNKILGGNKSPQGAISKHVDEGNQPKPQKIDIN